MIGNYWRFLVSGTIAAVVACGSALAQPPVFSLEQALTEANRTSARLRVSELQVEAQRASASDVSASLLPTLTANGSYAYASEVAELNLGPITRTLGDGNVWDFNLTARIPLYAGGALTERARAERSATRAAEYDLANDSLHLAYEVRRAFFNAIGAAKREEVAQQSVNRLERHWKELQGAKKAGMASDEMIIQTESRLRQSEASVLTAKGEAKAARLMLGNLVGHPGEEITPSDELENTLMSSDDGPSESRPDVAAMSSRIDQTRHATKAAQGSFLPALSAQAAYHYGKPGVDQFRYDWMDYGTVGVNLSWALWDWNSRASRVAQARAQSRAFEARHEELVDAVHTRIATARETVDAAHDAFTKAVERERLESQRFEMVEGRYRIGSSSESEYLDAQTDLTQAQLDRSAAAVKLRLAEAEWLYAAGR